MIRVPPASKDSRLQFLLAAIVLVQIAIAHELAAQQPNAVQGSQYQPPQDCPTDNTLPNGSRKACEQIKDSLQRFSREGPQLGQKAGQIVGQISTRTATIQGQTFQGVAIENPLDANNGNQGRQKAWEEYVHDSKAILNKTMIGCFEPRKVVGHPEYNTMCESICPRRVVVAPGCPECGPVPPIPGPPIPTGCKTQDHIVLEYYLPVYEIASNKAGARSLDVNMFNGNDNDPKLTRSRTAQHQEQQDKRSVPRELDRAGIDTSQLEWPDWHQPGEELNLQINQEGFDLTEGTQSMQIAYQTNLHAQATRDRPEEYWKGYDQDPKSGLWCFDEPSKKIVANSMDSGKGVYSLLSRMSEFTQVVSPEAYNSTVELNWNLQQTGHIEQLPQDIEPNYRVQEWQRPYADLRRLEVQPGGGQETKDWVFYGGSMAPFNVSRFNILSDPLRSDLFRAATAAYLFGAKQPEVQGLNQVNTDDRRILRFTKYKDRQAESRQGYSSSQNNVQDPIVFVDKLQLVYPPLKDGDPREASDCFRPENIANNEPGQTGQLVKTSDGFLAFPKDLRRQFLEQGVDELNRANETRVVVWQKRILCACQHCGRPSGCVTLNDGDFDEDRFAGNDEEFSEFPPPFKQLEPFMMEYARKKTPPQQYPFQEEFPQREVENDDGKTGPIQGAPGKGSASNPSSPTTRPMIIPPYSGPPKPGSPNPPGNKPGNGPANCKFDVDKILADTGSAGTGPPGSGQAGNASGSLAGLTSSVEGLQGSSPSQSQAIGQALGQLGTASANLQQASLQDQTNAGEEKRAEQALQALCLALQALKNAGLYDQNLASQFGEVASQLQGAYGVNFMGGGRSYRTRGRFSKTAEQRKAGYWNGSRKSR